MRILLFLYNGLLLLAFVLYVPVLVWKKKWHGGFGQRFGLCSLRLPPARTARIWMHAVSVGEVMVMAPLVERLIANGDNEVVVTTVTRTGHDMACQLFGQRCHVRYSPLDFSRANRRYLREVRPQALIVAETEIWPSLLYEADRFHVPVILVNGRISDRSYPAYFRFRRWLSPFLNRFDMFLVQTTKDAQRLIACGARQDKVRVLGNMKFDQVPAPADGKAGERGSGAEGRVLLVGSSHPGEEDLLLGVFDSLKKDDPALRLIICPRHVERAAEVREQVAAHGYEPLLFSGFDPLQWPAQGVVVVDRIGVLRDLYRLADVVFIGKTFRVGGGQNMIEPSALGRPVVVGPKTENFRGCMELLLRENAICQVQEEGQLAGAIRRLLQDEDHRRSMGERARSVVKNNQGVTDRVHRMVIERLAGVIQ